MKNYFLVLALVVLSVSLFAQFDWEAAGKPIRNGVNIEWFRAGTPTNDGDVVYVWSDTRNGDRDVWAQKVGQNGDLRWGEGGKLINGEINRQEDIVIINSGDAVITAWVDFRNEDAGDIYAQKLDYDGNIQWTASGVPLCLSGDTQISLNIVTDQQGGAYIIWIDHRNGNNDIYGVHINSDGTLASGWEQNGNPIVQEPGNQVGHTFWEDGEGGAILVWTDLQEQENANLFAQRIAPDGTLMWGDHGVVISNEEGDQTHPKISPDGTGNFIITWFDKRVSTNNGDIYAQRINLNGEKLWANDLLIYGDSDFQENPRIREADDNGVFVVWQDGRNEENTEDIYVQKISPDGQLLWNPNGVPVVNQPFNQKNPRIVTDNANGCWIIWDDARDNDFPNIDIYVQHLNSNGETMLQENGELVCNADGVQFAPLIKKSTNGYIFTTWGDNRGGFTGIYYQTFDQNGNPLLENNGKVIYTGLSGNARNYVVKRNYYGKPAIFWTDTRYAAGKSIYFQEVNQYGNFILPENGYRLTTPYSVSDETKQFDVVSNPAKNEMAIVYKKQLGDLHKIYVQIFDSNGTLQFPDSSFCVIENPEYNLGDGKFPALSILDAQNSAYLFAWSDNAFVNGDFFTYKLFAQKIQNGNRMWGSQAKLIYSDPDQAHDLNVEFAMENYIVWNAEEVTNKDLYIIKLDENGNPATGWQEGGLAISEAPSYQEKPKAVMLPNGNILCVWQDTRGGDSDIYGQIITPDANVLWTEDGKALVTAERDQFPSNIILRDDGFILSWEDNMEGNVTQIRQQKYDFNGNPVWAQPTDIIAGNFQATSPYQAATENGSNFVFWSDYRQEGESNLYAQKTDSSGNTQWNTDGLLVCNAIKNQNSPVAFTDDDNYVYTFWEDTRASGKTDIYAIYGQVINTDVGVFDNQITNDNLTVSVANYPNPFKNETNFTIQSPTKKVMDGIIKIYNLKGQLVKKVNVEKNFAKLKLSNSNKLSSGIYFYKFISKEGTSKPQKMIIIK